MSFEGGKAGLAGQHLVPPMSSIENPQTPLRFANLFWAYNLDSVSGPICGLLTLNLLAGRASRTQAGLYHHTWTFWHVLQCSRLHRHGDVPRAYKIASGADPKVIPTPLLPRVPPSLPLFLNQTPSS